MQYTKTKKGITVSVKKWANEVVIEQAGAVLGRETFTDHVVAVAMAKRLVASIK